MIEELGSQYRFSLAGLGFNGYDFFSRAVSSQLFKNKLRAK